MFDFFKQVVAFHPIHSTLAVQDWDLTSSGAHFALALFTFLYVDIIDATATLYSMARFSGVVDPESADFPRSTLAYCVDAMSISIGSLFGCSPVTAFIESGAGITEGGRTGLTAITTGTCFLISIFFAPIFASIPPWATGCTLILVGCMMMRQVTSVNWGYIGDALPAFVTIVSMPFTYSVAYGLIAGLFTYVCLNGAIYITRKVSFLILGREIEPPDADKGEYWTYKIGGTSPPVSFLLHSPLEMFRNVCFADISSQWFVRAVQGSLWRRDGHAVFVDENEHSGEGDRSFVGSEKELVEVQVASRPQAASESTQTHQE
jgi:adenine/guanine/hypoxanthine permease